MGLSRPSIDYVKEHLLETFIPGKKELSRRNLFSLFLGILSNNDVMFGAMAAVLGHIVNTLKNREHLGSW